MGFKSPLAIPLGISVGTLRRGFRTPLPFWNAGVVTVVATQAGTRTPLPFWNAGVVAAVPATARGFLTPLPFWNAGAGVQVTKGGAVVTRRRKLHLPPKFDESTLLFVEPSEVVKELIATGQLTVGDTTVKFDGVPEPLVRPVTPEFSALADQLDREIAELLHIKQVREFNSALLAHAEDQKLFEEELAMFLILMAESDN
jgi:hypothetical protein